MKNIIPILFAIPALMAIAAAVPPEALDSSTIAFVQGRGFVALNTNTMQWTNLTPPAPPEPKLFILSAIPESPSQLDPNTTVFIQKALVIGGVTNTWTPRTNFSGNLTNVLILEDSDMAVFRGFESNAVYGAGDFFELVLKPAAPGNRKLGLRVAP